MPANDVTVVTAMHGRSDLTLQLIEGLRFFEDALLPIIVVDDGSPEEVDRARIRELNDPQVMQICQPAIGVTAAWNRGIQNVGTRWLVLLNNDVHIAGPIVRALMTPLESRQHRLTGARLREETFVPEPVLSRHGGRQFLEGWCLAMACETWHELGGFDETLRLYWSDTDFQLRARTRWPAACCGVVSIPVSHEHGATTRTLPDRRARWLADRSRFLEKWS